MARQYRARTFKSGNSIALRLPKGLGIDQGVEMLVREEQGHYIVEPVERPRRKFDIEKVWGIGRDLDFKPIADEDRVFEHRPLLWDDPAWLASLPDRKP